jgi:hypothetical protein
MVVQIQIQLPELSAKTQEQLESPYNNMCEQRNEEENARGGQNNNDNHDYFLRVVVNAVATILQYWQAIARSSCWSTW